MKDINQACAEWNILGHKIEKNKDAGRPLLKEGLQDIMDRLAEAQDRIKYLSCLARETSHLHRNKSRRHETGQGHYYCRGSRIGALVPDGDTGVSHWVRTSAGHNHEGYFLAGHGGVPLDGLAVWARKEV